jgi:RHS repeat-associated protein
VSYDPWGKITETGSGALSDFAFTGHYIDRPTGLALSWWRGYDPNIGRWLSKDPIGLRGGVNLYAYVDNNPIEHTDPAGLIKDWDHEPRIPPPPPIPTCVDRCDYRLDDEIDRCRASRVDAPQGDVCAPPPGQETWDLTPACEAIANIFHDMCIDKCNHIDPIYPIPNDDHTHGRPQFAGK